jgi:hypothetical protein
VRRLSVASLDSGAESPVYGREPSVSSDRKDPAARPPWVGGDGRVAARNGFGDRAKLGAPRYASGGELVVSSGSQAAPDSCLAPGSAGSEPGGAVSFVGIISLQVPQGGATRDVRLIANWTLPGQVGAGASRLATIHDMPVVDQQSGRWYVKDIRASTQPMGLPMTRFASSWAVPRGSRSSGKHTDVHGREG